MEHIRLKEFIERLLLASEMFDVSIFLPQMIELLSYFSASSFPILNRFTNSTPNNLTGN